MSERINHKDLSGSLYGAWRAHPMTVFFRQFLTDYAEKLTAEAMERWKAGKHDAVIENYTRGIVNALEEIAICEWSVIEAFYEQTDSQQEESKDGKPPTE